METTIQTTGLAMDVKKGLTSNPKFLNSKYFYDARGSRIFQKIMNMPEYYLTNCEEEFFLTQKQLIYKSFVNNNQPFAIVELGAGDGIKTKILLEYFLVQNASLSYIPIDISEEAIKILIHDLEKLLPELKVKGKIGDYFQLMEELSAIDKTQKILLFLGSNIGNFNPLATITFLSHLRKVMNPEDKLFIGFDLKKDPEVIIKAYDDPHGLTASFNLNLLRRINDELDANFELLTFKHHEVYDPQTGTAKSYLVSRENNRLISGPLIKPSNSKSGNPFLWRCRKSMTFK
ncbi:MAG: L-histidine N(alpha)-methyltransferase [Bacteroidales bacterium]